MEIKSFRIKNYRSIKDSGDCYLSGDNVTILAGKNEAGKTAILEALEDFDTEKTIRQEAIYYPPEENEDSPPEIKITFTISKSEIIKISEANEFEYNKKIDVVEIIKTYPDNYYLSQNTTEKLGIEIPDGTKVEITKDRENLIEILKEVQLPHTNFPPLNFDNLPTSETALTNYRAIIEPQLETSKIQKIFLTKFDKYLEKISLFRKLDNAHADFIFEIKRYIPYFILFSSFEDKFPSEAPLDTAKDNSLISDLDLISDLKLDTIISGTPAQKKMHRRELNIKLREDYMKYWNQDESTISIDWGDQNLYFFIEDEDGRVLPPNMRSKGKQWHLAFYVRVTARSKEDVPNVILIDEPGLSLHARAQKDILSKLSDSSKEVPIIFSTHSPYLIETEKLNRIRLVSRSDEEGTLISNKIHKGAEEDTLTPIITAIGLDLSKGLDIAKNNNVLVEGISDYYYLSAFRELLDYKFKENVNFVPCVGADKFMFLVPLMLGWGLNYCTVLDNDRKGKEVEKKLVKEFGHTGINIVFASDNKDEEIEDLFLQKDFIEHILPDGTPKPPTDINNSKVFKQKGNGYDKVLLSKLFFEKVSNGGVLISDKTKDNINNLLKQIDYSLFSG